MRKILLLFLLAFMVPGCGLMRTTSRVHEKVKTHTVEKGRRTIRVPGDSVIYRPVIRYKDTVIVVENKNVVLKTVYRQDTIEQINCRQKEQQITEDYIKETEEKTRKRERITDGFTFKEIYLVYFFLIAAGLLTINNLTKRN